MQQLLFRDWRFALLWAIGLTASVAAFFSEGGGHEQLSQQTEQIRAERAGQADAASTGLAANGAAAMSAPADQEEAEPQFGEPMLDARPLDPAAEPVPDEEFAKAGEPDQPVQPWSEQ
ncbi:MAG: hypothetical protein ACK442_14640 [Novosphingobium sp.]|nr:hypothetical protein [Novosphingobium sp.]